MAFYPPPGPGPTGQSYDNAMDVDANEADADADSDLEDYVDNDAGGNVKNEADDDVDDDSSSETTTSSEASSQAGVDWLAVGVDYLTTQEAINALGKRKPIPRPPPASPRSAAPVHPPPRRIELNGVKTFVRWDPYWCDPEWDDAHYRIDVEEGEAAQWVDILPMDKQRPALLPKDALRNPTPYSQRFGIHPDQLDGRSRLSPSFSTTRRVQLSHAQQTPTGKKDYVNVQDVQECLTMNNHNPSESPSGYFRGLLETQAGNTDVVEAYLQLQDLLEQDELYQHVVLLDATTDDVRLSCY